MASLHYSLGARTLSQQSRPSRSIPNNVQSSLLATKLPPQFATTPKTLARKQNLKYEFRGNKEDIKWRVSCSNEGLVVGGSEPAQALALDFIHAINLKDSQKLGHLLSPNCVFQDPIFYIPFGGKQSIINFLCDVMDALGTSAQLVVDNVSAEDNHLSTTLTWHLEWKGKKIPFTGGCSFFEFEQLHDQGQLFIRIIIELSHPSQLTKILDEKCRKIVGMEELPVRPGELVLKLLKTTRMAFDSFPAAAEGLLEKSQGQGSPEGLLKLLDMLRAYMKK